MNQVSFREFGGPEALVVEKVPAPIPAKGEALVRIKTAAVNQLDATVRNGWFPMSKRPPLVLGNEGAGVLETDLLNIKRGTRVMVFPRGAGITADGSWREYVTADPSGIMPVPAALNFEEAAAVPIAFSTAQLALDQSRFEPGQTLLVSAAGGSVGNAILQLAKAERAKVISTASTSKKASRAREQGFEVIDLSQEKLRDGTKRLTSGRGIDIAFDTVGGSMLGDMLPTLADKGRVVSIGYTAGTNVSVNVVDLMAARASITGFNLFAATPEEMGSAWKKILSLLGDGKVRPVVDRVFPLAEAPRAQEYLASRRPYGKVVLSMES